MKTQTTSEIFCQTILGLKIDNSKALANLVMALSSDLKSKSVVGLSNSPLYHFQYSSICDVVSNLAKEATSHQVVSSIIEDFCLSYRSKTAERVYLQSDGVNVFRPHSPTLEGRKQVYKPNNVIVGNKPLGIGYTFSFINWSDAKNGWSLPCKIKCLGVEENLLDVAASQIEALCKADYFKECLVIDVCDSGYGNARYLSKTNKIENLVTLTRFRHGRKVYLPSTKKNKIGTPKIYGKKVYLNQKTGTKSYHKKGIPYLVNQESIYDTPAHEHITLSEKTAKGRALRVEVYRWNDLMIRSKNGNNMKEALFDLVSVQVLATETGQRVFKQDIFLAIEGKNKDKVGLEEAYSSYRHRFDLEVQNRFLKQNMFMQTYQSPDKQHMENWMLVMMLSCWLLYTAAPVVDQVCQKWQKYSEPSQEIGCLKTISQVRKGAEKLFLTFDKLPFLPQSRKKGKGRKKGDVQLKRERYKIYKKKAKAPV
jgi:hypothetical protein